MATLLLLAALSGCGGAAPESPWPVAPPNRGERPYLEALISQAGSQRLWEQRYWHILLHYRTDPFVGVTGEADGPGFYLSPEGKTDPRAELEATLAGFFSDTILEPGKMTAQCTFPARRTWLDEQLGIDWSRLPRDPCERFETWRVALDPDTITLIYASYYFNNPSSMFGHTLMRLDKRGRTDEQRLLDYSITYGAIVNADDNGFLWAIRGVFGGYDGYFSILPYYVKVREYNDFEDRDLWEYRLALTQEEIDRLLRHAWEMGSTYYDYFFFRENCSYHLMSLIEAARPELDLRSRFFLFTLPTATISAVADEPGLVDEIIYRPSRGSQFRWKLRPLNGGEEDLVYEVADAPGVAGGSAMQSLPVPTQARILEAATDIHQLRLAGAENEDEAGELRKAMRPLLIARSRLGYRREGPDDPPRPASPEQGHDTTRVFLGGGSGAYDGGDALGFYEVGLTPAFHDLMAQDDGYAPNSHIVGIALRLRYEPDAPEDAESPVRVERADLVDIISIFPLSRLKQQFSWKVRAGWERSRDLGCEACTPFILDGGIGLAGESHLLQREVAFVFLEPALQLDGQLERGYRLGAGGTAGLLLDFTANWRLELSASQRVYFAGVDETAVIESAQLRQRYALSRNVDLRLDVRGIEDYREVSAGISLFF